MGVRIRMKMMGRTHRKFFRIVAADSRAQRDGKVLEQLGTYDPAIKDTDSRVTLKASRVKHWLSVGAQPTEKVGFLLKKYLEKWEKIEKEGASAVAATAEASSESAEETPAGEENN